jgi:hypothetical protein
VRIGRERAEEAIALSICRSECKEETLLGLHYQNCVHAPMTGRVFLSLLRLMLFPDPVALR